MTSIKLPQSKRPHPQPGEKIDGWVMGGITSPTALANILLELAKELQ